MEPFMVYNGHHVFHYTKFESALKIIASGYLKFGDFKDMNDIAEAYREVFGMAEDSIINKVIADYQSISLTSDHLNRRGYSIDSLWGHYAQRGNGVCLVFDKKKLMMQAKKQYGKNIRISKVKYVSNYVSTIFTDGYNEEGVRQYVRENIKQIFFTKSKDWKYENELRIVKADNCDNQFLLYKDSLMAAILCLPKIDNYNEYKDSSEFKILKSVLPGKPILRYTTRLGNKELLDEDYEKTCGIVGIDYNLGI